jgi:hypothetical protein
LIVQHMGHTNERSRGDSRLRDWPDVEWRLTRETDDPASPRSITAYGRDVEIPNTALVYDSGTRRLTLGELVPDRAVVTQQKRNKMIEQALGVVVRWLYQGQHVDLSGRQIKEQMPDKGRPSVANIDAALKHGLQTGDLLSRDGPKGANLYRVAPESPIVREHEELQTFCKPKGTKA